MSALIDENGYRLNVGIVVSDGNGKLLWAKRTGYTNAWQFPQGGVHPDESVLEAMYRELHEELGLAPDQVAVLSETEDWLIYDLPEHFRRYHSKPLCIGQKQKWFLLRLLVDDSAVNLNAVANPEFESWCWVAKERALDEVIDFKRDVYRQMLQHFAPFLSRE